MGNGRLVVDLETGEILAKVHPGDRLTITRKNSLEALERMGMQEPKEGETEPVPNAQFFKVFREVVRKVVEECNLTAAEFSVFLYLSSNLRYQSNVAKHSNGELITKETVETELPLSKATTHRAINGLIRRGLIVEAKTEEGKVFVVNPFVCCVGDRINKTTFDLFRNSKWAKEYKAKTSIHPSEERR